MRVNPPRRKRKLSVAIPASIISDTPHLREKTSKIGMIGRALAIFRVEEAIIYPDRLEIDQRREANLIATILSYMETPQYMRKRIFKLRPELRYAGILPPLRTPHHPTDSRSEDLKVGELREGITIRRVKRGTLIDIGVEKPALMPKLWIKAGIRVTVKITEIGRQIKAKPISQNEITTYWGYKVTVSKSPLGRMVKERGFNLIIATSRWGDPIKDLMEKLAKDWKSSRSILIAFGSPTRGLRDILAQEGIKIEDFAHYIINTIPNQATETVRTEEALYTTLSILNLIED